MRLLNAKTCRKTAAAVLVCVLVLLTAQTPALAYDSLSTWQTRFDNYLAATDTDYYLHGDTNTPNSAYLAWGGTYALEALRRMYEVTGQTSYLQKLSQYINYMYSNLGDTDNDGYLGWGTDRYDGPEYHEYVVHHGLIITQWARFILLVRADPAVSNAVNPQGVTYGQQASSLESVINNHLVPRWNSMWTYQYNVYLDDIRPGRSLPYNQYMALAMGLYEMVKVNPENKHYLSWADEMVGRWKANLTANGTAYDWNYWDRLTPADNQWVPEEDWSHANVDLMVAIANYNRGGSFSVPTEMPKFGNTIYNVMWNGSATDPILSHYVDGTGSDDGEISNASADLQRWKDGIWTLFEKHKSLRDWSQPTSQNQLTDLAIIIQQHPQRPAPQAFTLSSPANGATNQNVELAFVWKPSVNASDYTLQISTSSSFSSYTVNRNNIIGTSAMVTGQSLSPNTTYYWRVISRNASGATCTSNTFSFTTRPAPSYVLTFSHRDNRSGSPQGYHYKQVLIDDVVVWESDAAADAADQWITASVDVTSNIAGKSHVHVKTRLYEKKGVSNYLIDVYWDDISITNVDFVNGGFETAPNWYYTENNPAFDGNFSTSTVHSGLKSLSMSLYQNTSTQAGDYSSIELLGGVVR